jgi:hypothetical protein
MMEVTAPRLTLVSRVVVGSSIEIKAVPQIVRYRNRQVVSSDATTGTSETKSSIPKTNANENMSEN